MGKISVCVPLSTVDIELVEGKGSGSGSVCSLFHSIHCQLSGVFCVLPVEFFCKRALFL
jgi:hypothetical protein